MRQGERTDMENDPRYRKLYDENNNVVYVPKEYSEVISKPVEFTVHDTSLGHCGLCGRMGCSGRCFM